MTQASSAGWTYVYDGNGQKVARQFPGSTTLYWTDLGGRTLAETDQSGALLNRCLYLNGALVARLDNAGSAFYYLRDHLGTTRKITTAAGAVCYDADAFPFGTDQVPVSRLERQGRASAVLEAGKSTDAKSLRLYAEQSDGRRRRRWKLPRRAGDLWVEAYRRASDELSLYNESRDVKEVGNGSQASKEDLHKDLTHTIVNGDEKGHQGFPT